MEGSVIPKDKLSEPEIDLDALMRKTVEVKAGLPLRLFATIHGRPQPEVKWSKEVLFSINYCLATCNHNVVG